ncbi:peptidoglycan bridge formation glycyltransferase FemA/FemB family protein [Candidatus Gottesmanbacteria bacterium]|nr:peptidoglycan bridge formation glycyltransferase FemA/FemB family protein [Candidatus Gottesmanbacteria bacterium]
MMTQTGRSIRPATQTDQTAWNAGAAHPLQSWAWGEFRAKMGIDVVRLTAISKRKFVSGWQITFHKLPHLPWTIGYFPKGPIPDKFMIEELRNLGKQKRAIFIQLEPNATKDSQFAIHSGQIKPSHHPLFTKYTFILDLTKSETELLASMHHKTRYNIKIAQKHGVVVKENNSAQAFKTYLALTKETTQRQAFYAHNENYHRNMWNVMKKAGVAHLFTATYNKTVLAAWIIFVWKDTIYYPYGASSRLFRETMAPTLLLWEIARWAKQKGFKYFDLWGALGPQPDPKDPWYGFHRFKQGFSPKLTEYVGSYDFILNPLLYNLYTVADVIRWSLLKTMPR